MSETTRLSIDDLRTDGDTQPRASLDEKTITEYSRAMERGVEFPPVQVMYDGSEYWLFDGFHRLEAACHLGRSTIKAEVHEGTREDAQWASLAANKAHGRRRTREDKRKTIKRALRGWGTEMSNSAIAEHIGCSDATVGKYRKQLEKDGEIPEVTRRKRGTDGGYVNTENMGSHMQKGKEDSSSPAEPDDSDSEPAASDSSSEPTEDDSSSESAKDDSTDDSKDDSTEEVPLQRQRQRAVTRLKKSCHNLLEVLNAGEVPPWIYPELKPVLDRVYRAAQPQTSDEGE